MTQEKLREYHHQLKEIQRVFDDIKTPLIPYSSISDYEKLVGSIHHDDPHIIDPLDKSEYYSHGKYYYIDSIKIHLGILIAKVGERIKEGYSDLAIEKKDFTFIKNNQIANIIRRDHQELQKSSISNSCKATIILSGGIIEGLLLDYLLRDETKAKSSSKAPSESDLYKWKLSELINVSVDLESKFSPVEKLSHSVREYRNLVHPGVEIRKSLKIEPEEAKIALEIVNILIREMSDL